MATPKFPRGDENAPPRKKSPVKNIQTGSSSLRVPDGSNSPFSPTAASFVLGEVTHNETHATLYTSKIPFYHPPYENPIDGRYCLHFDTSAEMKKFRPQEYEADPKGMFSREFIQKMVRMMDSLEPPVSAGLELCTCVTSAARATAAANRDPEESPPLFCIDFGTTEGRDMCEVYDAFKDLLETEFPRAKYPECYPKNGELIIRFMASYGDMPFAQGKAKMSLGQQLLTPPEPSKALPPTIEREYQHDRVPGAIQSKIFAEPYREFFPPDENLFGASLSVYGQRGQNVVGTMGCFVYLVDDRTGTFVLDENENPQIFGMTCTHVVQNTFEEFHAGIDAPIVMACLSRRDRENTYFSQLHRREQMHEEIKRLAPKAIQYKPGRDQFEGLLDDKNLEIKQAFYTREMMKQQYLKDEKIKYEEVAERRIGTVFLAGGRHQVAITGQLEGFDKQPGRDTIISDWALIKMDPSVYPNCKNQFPEAKFPLWHPAVADTARCHRSLTSVKPLKPETVIVKAGRSTDITYAKVGIVRERYNGDVKAFDGSYECCASPFEPGAFFSREGDSGGAIMDVSDGALVGIVMGGRKNDITRNYVLPIQVIEMELKKSGYSLKLHMGHLDDIPTISETVINAALARATANAVPGQAWEDGTGGHVLSCGHHRDGELWYHVKPEGTEQTVQVPRQSLNKTWQKAISAFEAKVKVSQGTPLRKRPVATTGFDDSPGVQVSERVKQARGLRDLPNRSK